MDDALFTAFRLADSFLPVGSYSSSYGLEQFVATDRVTEASELERLLESYLQQQVGPAELVALRAAHAATSEGDVERIVNADERLHASTLPAEFRESATRAGRQLLQLELELSHSALVLEAYRARESPRQYPVVVGAVAAAGGLDVTTACQVHVYAFCSAMLGAAQRLLSLGHTRAQQCLSALEPAMVAAVEASTDRDLADIQSFAPLVEIQSAKHERATRRLFVS